MTLVKFQVRCNHFKLKTVIIQSFKINQQLESKKSKCNNCKRIYNWKHRVYNYLNS